MDAFSLFGVSVQQVLSDARQTGGASSTLSVCSVQTRIGASFSGTVSPRCLLFHSKSVTSLPTTFWTCGTRLKAFVPWAL